MRNVAFALVAFVGTVMLLPAPAGAQEYRTSAGWSVGALYGTSLNDGADAGVDISPEVTPSLAFHVDHWWRQGRAGVRLQVDAAQPEIEWSDGPREIAVYSGDLSLMLRPLPPSPDRRVAPYVSVGVGANWWLLGNGPPVRFSEAGVRYGGDEFFYVVGVGSVGVDVITPVELESGPLVIRIEGRDAVQVQSPFAPFGSGGDFGPIHNIRVGIGVHAGIGSLGR